MAAITTSRSIAISSGIASAEEIQTVFDENRRQLMWLAEFLTGDEMMASACVLDACAASEYQLGQDCFWTWTRDATILSTVDLFRVRIAQLASAYDRREYVDGQLAPLGSETIQFVVSHSDTIRRRLDVLCRVVLILCGVEQRPTGEAALLLGVSNHAVEAAYCAVLESLEIIDCDAILEEYGGAATVN